jgi:hypothetical protein
MKVNRRSFVVATATGLVGSQARNPSTAATTSDLGQAAIFPIELRIPAIGIVARIEEVRVTNGILEPPTNLAIACWYQGSSMLGTEHGNTLLSGYYWWGERPALMADLALVTEGDAISLLGDNDQTYLYLVTRVATVEKSTADLQLIVGDTEIPSLTIIADTGMPDQSNMFPFSIYVRAERR